MAYLKDDSPAHTEGCVFCKKIDAEDDAEHMLARGKFCFVTLNLYPYTNGHLMVVPYEHVGSLEALEPPTLTEMMVMTQRALAVLRQAYRPQAFNVGMNLGEAAGAGIAAHLHQHIVPRWAGDTNYMTVIGETRVIPEWIDETYHRLKGIWNDLYPPDHS